MSGVSKQTYQEHTSQDRHKYRQSRIEIGNSDFGSIRKVSCGFGASSQKSPTMAMAPVQIIQNRREQY